jgi:predicted RNA-binding Zn ribbon-like protein
MGTSPRSRSFAPELPLKFVGGDPSLDLVNTVDWTAAGLENDRLVDCRRVIEWAGGASVIDRSFRARLLKLARGSPHAARFAYEHARWTRSVLQRLYASVVTRNASAPALEEFNRLLRDAGRHLSLAFADRGGGGVEWRPDDAADLRVVSWTVARSAAKLLESDSERLRVCAGPDCGWMYVDRSRNGLRRWCEMQTCGTLAKSRRRADRRAALQARKRKAAL